MQLLMTNQEMERTLLRISRDLVESHPDLQEAALVGIRRRGVPLARRLKRHIEDLTGHRLPLGILDINFYRDDLSLVGPQPIVGASQLDFPVAGRTLLLVDDVLYTGRTVRAALESLLDTAVPNGLSWWRSSTGDTASFPSRPITWVAGSIPGKTRWSTCTSPRGSGRGSVSHPEGLLGHAAQQPASTGHRRDAARRHRVDSEHGTRLQGDRHPSIKKVPTLRGRSIINLFYEASTRTRSSFEIAAKRLSADILNFSVSHQQRGKGGDPRRHGPQPGVHESRDHRPSASGGRSALASGRSVP